MAKLKKTAKKTAGRTGKAGTQAQAEQLTKTLSESAQQIWLAGVGAFARAQSEGTRLFESLVKEGLNLENAARKLAGRRADDVRDAVESRVEQARDRATDTWDRLEKVFEARVQRALVQLGVPAREDLQELSARVESLTAELRRQSPGRPAARRATGTRAAAKKTVTKKAPARKAPAKKAAARKSASAPK